MNRIDLTKKLITDMPPQIVDDSVICVSLLSKEKSMRGICQMCGERPDNLNEQISALERELYQQRFNNEHNLSIDGVIVDKIIALEKQLEIAREALVYYGARMGMGGTARRALEQIEQIAKTGSEQVGEIK